MLTACTHSSLQEFSQILALVMKKRKKAPYFKGAGIVDQFTEGKVSPGACQVSVSSRALLIEPTEGDVTVG